MKTKLLLLLLLIFLFGGFIGSKFFILDKQNAAGQLKVTATPDAEVFVNNAPVGNTPYEGRLKIGEYLVKLIPDKTATETASWQGKVQVYKNAVSYINRELGNSDTFSAGEIFTITRMQTKPDKADVGEIAVDTDPTGALVNLDNDEKGVAPLILADVLKGDHEISVYRPGFLRRTQKVNVSAGYRINTSFKLAYDPASAPQVASTEADLNPKIKKEASPSAAVKKAMVVIGDTPTGFLRVRSEPSISASESARVNPGEKYELLEEKSGWYKIKLPDISGWVYSQYATKQD